ncbi:IniB N-terminal domain-containing protein [Microbacterium esteraromaticum]|uniref:IniB N-terminal domain-containing protein n=1 Tax=Microbacterium esteraromaticum TaxID=57043 RepID=UPI001C95F9DE|nr:IniB N-terminal domain-containing protein [Microbacterium esteraromaticum]MBY6060356.1 IniB N-terminal domain-containing protein [Microbacterium esteraromaticum]
MTSPVETIADALFAFILSLLRDQNAADEFAARPTATLAENGLQDVCMADVDAVRPVIVDHPRVIHHDTPPPPPPPGPDSHETVREIVRMVQQYTTVDARSTIVDQSVNQNIWTEGGDVTQLFDQEAVVASGDESIAAGEDVSVVDSDVDVTVGDVSIGNETNDGSFNQVGTMPEETMPEEGAVVEGAAGGEGADATVPEEATPEDVATATATTAAAVTEVTEAAAPAAAPPPPPADVPEPADLLESDMTAGEGDSYGAESSAPVDDAPLDAPLEDD